MTAGCIFSTRSARPCRWMEHRAAASAQHLQQSQINYATSNTMRDGWLVGNFIHSRESWDGSQPNQFAPSERIRHYMNVLFLVLWDAARARIKIIICAHTRIERHAAVRQRAAFQTRALLCNKHQHMILCCGDFRVCERMMRGILCYGNTIWSTLHCIWASFMNSQNLAMENISKIWMI